ncbi:glycosyltransferase [Nonomuraea longicatena]|uniref:Glycosyltransferase n=1 Tax=Nonomuraea longicatena TaxID=83682 RepID=A0ABP4AGN9_9ACTN
MALAARLRERGAEVRVCAPPDEVFERRLAHVGAPLVPVGPSARALTTSAPRPTTLPERAAELIAGQFETVTAAAEGCDVLVATGMLPAAAGARSVAEMLGIRCVSVTFQQLTLPSPHRAPLAYPGRPFPPEVTDNRVLWELDARTADELFGEALNSNRTAAGLPPVGHVRDYAEGERPWLASDPVLDPWRDGPELGVVQTGAWIVQDERPLPAGLAEFLADGEPPVYVGFGSMPMHGAADAAGQAVEAVRAQGRRAVVSRGWADLSVVDGQDDCFVVGEVNHQALFGRVAAVVHHGGAGTTTAATRSGTPQVVVPQVADQPYWAGRVAELGVGVAHDGPVPTAESLSAALAAVLNPETRARAAAVAATVRTDGAAVAAGLLLGETG